MSDPASEPTPRRSRDNVVELARGKGVTLDRTGGVQLPDLTPRQRKELLGAEIGTAFDMYTRMFAAFSGGDVFEIGEWRVRDLDSMLSRDGTAKALEQVLTLPIRQAAFSFQAAPGDTGELDLILEHFASPSEAVASGNLGETTGPVGACAPGLRTIIGQMAMASIYRKAFFEKRYIIDDNGIVRLADLAWRPPATCEVKRDEHTAKFDGFRQRAWWFFAQSCNSLVQTPNGRKRIGDLEPGDLVFGANGEATCVKYRADKGVRKMYRVRFADHTFVDCDIDHLWGVYERSNDSADRSSYRVLSVGELLATGLRSKNNRRYRFTVQRCAPVQYPTRTLPIDAYILGAWIGDGNISDYTGNRPGSASIADFELDAPVASEIERRLPEDIELRLSTRSWYFRPVVAYDQNPLRDALISLGVNKTSKERFIPRIYLEADVKQRLDLLRGLMDTDGSIKSTGGTRNSSVFYTSSPQLASDVQELVQSLGGTAIIRRNPARGHRDYPSDSETGIEEIVVKLVTEECPFLMPRKAKHWSRGRNRSLKAIVSIESVGDSECCCISVEAEDGLYLTDSFIVTHNSDPSMAKKRYATEWGKNFTGYLDIPKQRSFVYIHGQHRNPLIGTSDMDVPYWALAHGQIVQTIDGPRKVENVKIGDKVFGADGDIGEVTEIHPRGYRQMYKLVFEDGTFVRCDEDHQWEVSCKGPIGSGLVRTGVLSVKQMLEGRNPQKSRFKGSSTRRYWIRPCDPVPYPERELPEDPYKVGWTIRRRDSDAWIPKEYLRASIDQRKALLAGICDHGKARISHREKRQRTPIRVQLVTRSRQYAKDVCALVQSLGGVVWRQYDSKSYRLSFVTPFNPFRNHFHRDDWRPPIGLRRMISEIVPDGGSECRCITVSTANHLFLTNSFIPTHNCYKQKLKLMFLWWQFLENQALPKIAAYGADQPQADDNADAIASMRSSAVGGFIRPAGGQKLFDVIEASGAGAAQFRDALNFLDNFQTLSVLAGFLNLPSAAMLGRGSYALSESQTDFFNKPLSRDTIVRTPAGDRQIGDITIGDEVFGADGRPTKVVGVYPQGILDALRVDFTDGTSIVCSSGHLWNVIDLSRRIPGEETLTLSEIVSRGVRFGANRRDNQRFAIPICRPVEYPEKELPIDPYALGAWIGDGSIGLNRKTGQRDGNVVLSCWDPEIAQEFSQRLPDELYLAVSKKGHQYSIRDRRNSPTRGGRRIAGKRQPNLFRSFLVSHRLNVKSPERFIPRAYLYGSKRQRIDLLRGLMDTDGSPTNYPNDMSTFGTSSQQLALDVAELVRSLGGIARVTGPRIITQQFTRRRTGESYTHETTQYLVHIRTPGNPFMLKRKRNGWCPPESVREHNAKFKRISSVTPVGKASMVCISVDAPDGLFLAGDYTVTHNSRQGVIYEMQEAFTRDVIAPIIILNRGPDASIPRLTSTRISAVDNAQILSVFSQLATAPALRVPDQLADMMAEKVASLFDLPLDRVAKMIQDGAKIRAMQGITNSPVGATKAGQEAAKLAATLDATFTVLQGAGAGLGEANPMGMNTSAMGLDGGVNGGGQSVQEDLNRGL